MFNGNLSTDILVLSSLVVSKIFLSLHFLCLCQMYQLNFITSMNLWVCPTQHFWPLSVKYYLFTTTLSTEHGADQQKVLELENGTILLFYLDGRYFKFFVNYFDIYSLQLFSVITHSFPREARLPAAHQPRLHCVHIHLFVGRNLIQISIPVSEAQPRCVSKNKWPSLCERGEENN